MSDLKIGDEVTVDEDCYLIKATRHKHCIGKIVKILNNHSALVIANTGGISITYNIRPSLIPKQNRFDIILRRINDNP